MQQAGTARDWTLLRSCFTEDFVNHASPFHGADGMRQTLEAIARDLQVDEHVVHDTVAEADRVVQRVTLSGTHIGSTMPLLAGLPAAGRPFRWDFIHIWRLDGERIAEHWACRDDLGLRGQLGPA
jgi:lactoylglutathione lyase